MNKVKLYKVKKKQKYHKWDYLDTLLSKEIEIKNTKDVTIWKKHQYKEMCKYIEETDYYLISFNTYSQQKAYNYDGLLDWHNICLDYTKEIKVCFQKYKILIKTTFHTEEPIILYQYPFTFEWMDFIDIYNFPSKYKLLIKNIKPIGDE